MLQNTSHMGFIHCNIDSEAWNKALWEHYTKWCSTCIKTLSLCETPCSHQDPAHIFQRHRELTHENTEVNIVPSNYDALKTNTLVVQAFAHKPMNVLAFPEPQDSELVLSSIANTLEVAAIQEISLSGRPYRNIEPWGWDTQATG